MVASPTLSERLRATRRILFGRGDDAVACSFCGRDRLGGSDIVAGPGVAICGSCAHVALEYISAQQAGAALPEGTSETGVIVMESPACLLPDFQATIAEDLTVAAASLSCAVRGWSYACGAEAGDHLSVRLARPAHVSAEDLTERFIAAFLLPGGGGSNSHSSCAGR